MSETEGPRCGHQGSFFPQAHLTSSSPDPRDLEGWVLSKVLVLAELCPLRAPGSHLPFDPFHFCPWLHVYLPPHGFC
jgi:hypothetical protein